MKIITKIAYPLTILMIAALCSLPGLASAQNDDYYNDDNYSNNDNSYNNQDYNYNNDNYNYNDDYYDDPNDYDVEPSAVNINVFNNALTPYGSWVVSASYGRCWVPR